MKSPHLAARRFFGDSKGETVDVCVLGRIGYDLYAMEQNRPLAEVEHFSRHLGGSSANTAFGLARLGLQVGIISAVGKDGLADFLLGALRREGVDTQFVRLVEGYDTSLAITEVWPPERFNQVFYRSKPADTQVTFGAGERAYLQQARMFVTNGTSLAASPAREATREALRTAREAGLRTVFDIDYRASSWPSAGEAGRLARSVLPWVEVILGNETELSLLTEESDPGAQLRQLHGQGIGVVVRKLGARGVEVHTARESHAVAPFPMPVVCAIGGGDGFAAGFLFALYRERPLEECLRYGNASAAVVVSRVSCSDAMPRREELEELLRAGKG